MVVSLEYAEKTLDRMRAMQEYKDGFLNGSLKMAITIPIGEIEPDSPISERENYCIYMEHGEGLTRKLLSINELQGVRVYKRHV